jgi:hypothetical protein
MDHKFIPGLPGNLVWWKILAIVALIAVLSAAGVRWGLARQAGAPATLEIEPKSPQGYGDEGIKEVGVEWINDFPGTDGDRSHWDESCDGLYYGLTGSGWTGGFHYTDWSAWETDFKRSALGGSENSYVDSVDIAMLCTHGSGAHDSVWDKDLSSVYFGSSHADQHLSPGDGYYSYGDKDLEFLAFDSCSVLSDGGPAPYYNRGYWSTVMNGLHLLLGFNNTMYVWAPGDGVYWAFFMKGMGFWMPPVTVTQAWFLAADYNQPSVTCARVLAETNSNFNEYLHGYGYVGPDPAVDGYYWYWDHCSAGLKQQDLAYTGPTQLAVPVFQVTQRLVDEDFVFNRVAPAFDITGTLQHDDMFFYLADTSGGFTRTLQVDRVSGSFNYRNWGSLWTTPTFTPTLPTGQDAYMRAEEFFKMQGEGLPGVWNRFGRYMYNTEDLVQETVPGKGNGITEEISRLPANGLLNYERVVSGPAKTTEGIQLADFPVVGPGGRLRIYFGDGGEIIGMMGGARDVIATKAMIEVMTAEEAWANFLAEPTLAIPEVPWVAEYITYTSAVLGYYEMPYLTFQNELIPVWIFNANFFGPGMELLEGDVQVSVPAAKEYMPPLVSITEPISGTLFAPGETIVFSSTIQGGLTPYTITWSSSIDGVLGNTEDIIASLSGEAKGTDVLFHAIEVEVTDSNGLSGSATVMVKVMVRVYLPTINKPTPK